jgi:hypothetical protein
MVLDRLHGLDDMGIRVEDPVAVACHQRTSLTAG